MYASVIAASSILLVSHSHQPSPKHHPGCIKSSTTASPLCHPPQSSYKLCMFISFSHFAKKPWRIKPLSYLFYRLLTMSTFTPCPFPPSLLSAVTLKTMSTNSSPAPITSTPIHQNVVPAEVGWQFVPQYYTFVNKHPNRLYCFYTKNSTFMHGLEGEDGRPCHGQKVCLVAL